MSVVNHVHPFGDGVNGADGNANVTPMVQGTVPPTNAPDVGEAAFGRERVGSTARPA